MAVLLPIIGLLISCEPVRAPQNSDSRSHEAKLENELPGYKVTFIELGSMRCHSCIKMVKVLEAVEKKYGDQVAVIFYDVITPEGKPFAKQYNINLIPTQVFLNAQGEEFFRHEGYFSEKEVVKVLKQQGVRRRSFLDSDSLFGFRSTESK